MPELSRFEKFIAVGGLLITAVGGTIEYAKYRSDMVRKQSDPNSFDLTVKDHNQRPTSDSKNELVEKQQTPATEKQPSTQAESDPRKSSPEQDPLKSTEPQKKPFTFWGSLPSTPRHDNPLGIFFEVRRCIIDKALVTCIMTATSPRYDRQLSFNSSGTTVTDSEGDVLRGHIPQYIQLQLDRDAPVPFKLEFPVNKDVVRPIIVRMDGFVPQYGELKAGFRLGS